MARLQGQSLNEFEKTKKHLNDLLIKIWRGVKPRDEWSITVTNKSDPLESDMSIKKARYVSRNIELNQEFYFSTAETRMTNNEVYNSSWFGSEFPLTLVFQKYSRYLERDMNWTAKREMRLDFTVIQSVLAKPDR